MNKSVLFALLCGSCRPWHSTATSTVEMGIDHSF